MYGHITTPSVLWGMTAEILHSLFALFFERVFSCRPPSARERTRAVMRTPRIARALRVSMNPLASDPPSDPLSKPFGGARERAPSRDFSNSLTVMALAQRTAMVLNVAARVHPLIC